MRRDVSHQQSTDSIDEILRTLVRMLARAAAREVLVTTPQKEAEEQRSSLTDEGSNDAE
jgi:hypothetical protein